MISYSSYQVDFPDELVEHLDQFNYLVHLKDDQGWYRHLHIIAAICDDQVIGHIALIHRKLCLTNDQELARCGENLTELFVQTFRVNDAFQKKGIGRSLQKRALELAKQLNCYQLRSWSSVDKKINYRLKLAMGFAFSPAKMTLDSGKVIHGGYFVMRTSES